MLLCLTRRPVAIRRRTDAATLGVGKIARVYMCKERKKGDGTSIPCRLPWGKVLDRGWMDGSLWRRVGLPGPDQTRPDQNRRRGDGIRMKGTVSPGLSSARNHATQLFSLSTLQRCGRPRDLARQARVRGTVAQVHLERGGGPERWPKSRPRSWCQERGLFSKKTTGPAGGRVCGVTRTSGTKTDKRRGDVQRKALNRIETHVPFRNMVSGVLEKF